MKTKSKTYGYIIRGGAIIVLLLSALAGLLTPAAQNSAQVGALSFADRVAYQRAIEDVYWRHRIWPKENAKPKPSLDEVMSQAQIEKKVKDYLRDSQALEAYQQKPIAPEQLQAEMERMARNTKQPEVLRELFEALGNDPFVIAECLARPVLTERLIAELSARDKGQRFALLRTQAARSKFSITTSGRATYALPEISIPDGCIDDTWTPTTLANTPDARSSHTAVWTGSEMIVWGGYAGGSNYLNTGGRYNPTTDTWTATSTANAPAGRAFPTAVWTGSEMIVWGGDNGLWLNTGGRYDPSTDTWTATSTTNPPAAREFHTAVWTGSEMIVWGGYANGIYLNTGGRYNASTNSWTTTSTIGAPAGRYAQTVVWTGSQMIIWGGSPDGGISYLNTGGRYNASTDSWAATSLTNAPPARGFHTAVWTGSQMLIWGGAGVNNVLLNTGGRYDPSTDSWTTTSTTNAPDARDFHTAVWTGSEMIVWGGQAFGPVYLNTGGRYCATPPGPTPTPTATATATPTATVSPTPRATPTPRPRPTPAPRP